MKKDKDIEDYIEIDIERIQASIDSGFNLAPNGFNEEQLLEFIMHDGEDDILSKEIVDRLWEESGLNREEHDRKFKELLNKFV